jgi:hypothetical protein
MVIRLHQYNQAHSRTNIPKDKGQQEREQKANNSSHLKTKASPHKHNLDTKAQDGK